MARPEDREPPAVDGRRGLEQPPERLRSGGARAWVAGVAIVACVGIALWQPWTASVTAPALPSAAAIERGTAVASPVDLGSPSLAAPTSPSSLPGTTGTAFYTTITDHEWTVVALLTAGAPSREEPAAPHPTTSPGEPLLVLQQGLTPLGVPVGRRVLLAQMCSLATGARDRSAVSLPAGRVAYLGVTVPSSVPRPRVTALRLDQPADLLEHLPAPTVRLAGMAPTTLYVIPVAGPGAAVLFGRAAQGVMAAGMYQFTVASPGATGDRYLYACITR